MKLNINISEAYYSPSLSGRLAGPQGHLIANEGNVLGQSRETTNTLVTSRPLYTQPLHGQSLASVRILFLHVVTFALT